MNNKKRQKQKQADKKGTTVAKVQRIREVIQQELNQRKHEKSN